MHTISAPDKGFAFNASCLLLLCVCVCVRCSTRDETSESELCERVMQQHPTQPRNERPRHKAAFYLSRHNIVISCCKSNQLRGFVHLIMYYTSDNRFMCAAFLNIDNRINITAQCCIAGKIKGPTFN